MSSNTPAYKWHRVKNGRHLLAGITLRAERNDAAGEHRIVEAYAGSRFTAQGYFESVPAKGYDDWKAGALEGLTYALSKLDGYWTVTVEYLDGLSADTTPAAIAYVAMRALWEQVGYEPEAREISRLEEVVLNG